MSSRGTFGVLLAFVFLGLVPRAASQMMPSDDVMMPGGGPPPPPVPQPGPALQARAPYASLDRIQGPWTNLGDIVPFRPMVLSSDGLRLYAVNTYASTVQVFEDPSGQPAHTWPVAWGPVSIARHDAAQTAQPELVVVCRGSHVLCFLDRFDGTLLEVLELPFEPADIVIAPGTDLAYVSCSGADQVVEVALDARRITRRFEIPAKHPAYLSLDAGGDVLVAPMFSGNNSMILPAAGTSFIVDMANPAFSTTGLPDLDLFRIDRASGEVRPVARSTGTILFAQALNPATGKLWQLNWEAKNKDLQKQSEPAIRGDFVDNRLTIVTLPTTPGGIATGHQIINLDDTDRTTPVVEFDPTRTVGQPCGLEFASNGYAFVTGMATDNVTLLAPNGNFVLEWDCPAGSIPRASLLHPNGVWLFVYCWGTNKVQAYSLAPFTGTPFLSFDLGFDPTPEVVRQGREIFYDASHSLHDNATCGSCHVDGRADGLAWNLSNKPFDEKGPLVTQTLAGIQRLAPFHWRGERTSLKDFNGAFTGLLGATQMLDESPGGDFDRFQAFVFSLQNTANPGQSPERELDDALAGVEASGLEGSAVAGQQKFLNLHSDGVLTCADCHSLPTASNNDRILENFTPFAQQTHIETTAFNELWRKEQRLVQVNLLGNTVTTPLNGFGLLHDGTIDDLFAFVRAFSIGAQDVADITAFVRQFDEGQSPAIHAAILLDQGHVTNTRKIEALLLKQARAGWISVAARGQVRLGTALRTLTWAYDPRAEVFVPEDSSVAPLSLAAFKSLAQQDQAHVVFIGLPLGNAATWIDEDQDDAKNLDEARRFANRRDPDTDDDGFLDGTELRLGSDPASAASTPVDTRDPSVTNLEVNWVTARDASLTFETDELATWSLSYTASVDGIAHSVSSGALAKVHKVLLQDLFPSTPSAPPLLPGTTATYSGTLTVTDDSGRARAITIPAFTTGKFIIVFSPNFALAVVVTGDLAFTNVLRSPGGVMRLQGRLRTDWKVGGPPPIHGRNYVPIANVLVNGAIWSNFTSAAGGATSFKLQGVPYTSMPGPFAILPPTAVDGTTTFDLTVTGIPPGAEVSFNVIGTCLVDPATYDPTAPDFGGPTNTVPMGDWSFADTAKQLRTISVTY